MTEKEKQQAGELYNADDRELVNERIKAKKLCSEYNAVECNDFQKRERILERLLAMKGKKTVIEPNFFCDYGYNILLGDNFYSNHNLVILDCAQVVFGDNIFIGPNCGFYTAEHPVDAALRNQGLEYAKPITVGDNVWIGGGVNVIGGVTIGDNVVIGAGSVVTLVSDESKIGAVIGVSGDKFSVLIDGAVRTFYREQIKLKQESETKDYLKNILWEHFI